MTEAEWLACDDARQLLEALRGMASARKLRLLACGTARDLPLILSDTQCLDALLVAERYAEGSIPETDREATFSAVCRYSLQLGSAHERYLLAFLAAFAVGSRAGDIETHIRSTRQRSSFVFVRVATIREIFGNPFRPVAFSPEWRTSTAVPLATQMYESRDFSAMPILADALQDAGCDNYDILTHCRDANATHVRGCWVVDIILSKDR
jgi:hypothetical protein